MKTHKYSKIYIIWVFAAISAFAAAQCITAVSAWIKSEGIALTRENDGGELITQGNGYAENFAAYGFESPGEQEENPPAPPVILEFNGLPGCFAAYKNTLEFLPLEYSGWELSEIWGNGAYVMFYGDNENNIGYEIDINIVNTQDYSRAVNYTMVKNYAFAAFSGGYRYGFEDETNTEEGVKIPYKLIPGDILTVTVFGYTDGGGFFEVFPEGDENWPLEPETQNNRPAGDVIGDIEDITVPEETTESEEETVEETTEETDEPEEETDEEITEPDTTTETTETTETEEPEEETVEEITETAANLTSGPAEEPVETVNSSGGDETTEETNLETTIDSD